MVRADADAGEPREEMRHTVTASVEDVDGDPVPDVMVRFSVSGTVTTAGSCKTNASGQCDFTYAGPSVPGPDIISAYGDSNDNDVQDPGEPGGTAEKTWTAGPPAVLTLSPATDTNVVGTSHTVTAQVQDSFGNPTPGVVVRFTVVGSVSASGVCTAGATGSCDFTYAGPSLSGADAIAAYADSDGDGAQSPDEPAAEATKAWITPASTPGEVHGAGHIPGVALDKVAFGFHARSTDKGLKGDCQVVDHAPDPNRMIKCIDVTALMVAGNMAMIYGNALDGDTLTTYVIQVSDNAKPGSGSDTFSIVTGSGFTAGGVLERGDIHVRD